jgi:hypothetical protein
MALTLESEIIGYLEHHVERMRFRRSPRVMIPDPGCATEPVQERTHSVWNRGAVSIAEGTGPAPLISNAILLDRFSYGLDHKPL